MIRQTRHFGINFELYDGGSTLKYRQQYEVKYL